MTFVLIALTLAVGIAAYLMGFAAGRLRGRCEAFQQAALGLEEQRRHFGAAVAAVKEGRL